MKAEKHIQNCVVRAVRKAGFTLSGADDVSVMEPKQKGHGDLAVNIALILASSEKKNPREIAAATCIAEMAVPGDERARRCSGMPERRQSSMSPGRPVSPKRDRPMLPLTILQVKN